MSLGVLVAVVDSAIEQRLVAAFAQPGGPIYVARRCVDLPDLLAAASSGVARAALVTGDLRRLDGEALSRLRAAGVAVAALAVDEPAERALRGMGVGVVLPVDADPDAVATALVDAARGIVDAPATARTDVAVPPAADLPDADFERGTVIAVWGPPGAPGRTLVATSLASEFALLGLSTLLVDADVYAASVAQAIGLLDEVSGVAAAARAANLGTLDVPTLAGHARAVEFGRTQVTAGGSLRVLSGLPRADRWPELRPAAMSRVLDVARSLCAVTVVDCSACVERDEELSYDIAVPRRNGATLAALADADQVLAVGAADPVGLARLVRGLFDLGEAVEGIRPHVVVNRLRSGPVPGNPAKEVRGALDRFAGVRSLSLLPEDRAAVDAGLAAGRLLAEVAPTSPLRVAVRALAAELSGRPDPARVRGSRRLPARRPRRAILATPKREAESRS